MNTIEPRLTMGTESLDCTWLLSKSGFQWWW